MKILLTGATGYIARRLLPVLVEAGHEVYCLVRDPKRFHWHDNYQGHVTLIEGDLLNLKKLPKEIDVAYYLVHSMATKTADFATLEARSAVNFVKALEKTEAKQIIYLSGLAHDNNLSMHLASRQRVEKKLQTSKIPVTVLRAGIIVGSGSASFEIMRDLVEKVPIMVAPRWVSKRCQPIAIDDVIDYLTKVANHPKCLGKTFEIGGPDVMTYKELLLTLAKVRSLHRFIFVLPLLTPYLSALWLIFITSTNFSLARSLIESLHHDAICEDSSIDQVIPKKCLTYEEAVKRAFSKMKQNAVASSWRDSWEQSGLGSHLSDYIEFPKMGCFQEKRVVPIKGDPKGVLDRIWSIGGDKGWYSMNWAWNIRGLIDRLFGGTGIRRGRTDPNKLRPGDALDFWRVIYADREKGRLLLFAEMKLPGEAWLEFKIENHSLCQTAIFRPRGVWGRLYWHLMYPFHLIIFRNMSRAIAGASEQ